MIVSDIETDGLLDVVSKFHCAWTYDYKTGEYTGYRPNEFSKYIAYLEQKTSEDELIVFHNGIGYDHQALSTLTRKLLNRELNVPSRNVLDTLVLSKILYQNLKGSDMGLIRAKILSPKNLGKHSLDAWGQRLGELKGDYKDTFKANVIASGEDYQAGDEWLLFNEAMYDYNKQDVVVGKAVLDKFLADPYYFNENVTGTSTATEFWENTLEAIEVEHRAAWLMVKMHDNGFPMDISKARQIESEARTEHSKILIELVDYFGSWWEPKGGKAGRSFYRDPETGETDTGAPLVVYPKAGSVYTKAGTLSKSLYCKGAPYTPIQFITFNPASRDHIRRMLDKAGWEPTEFTETGAPKVDDEALASVKVDDPIAQKSIELIRRYLMIDKRLGQVADGNNAWLKHYNEETKCIHGSVNPNGTVTTRATHHKPNMGQVPKPSFDDDTKEMLRGMAGGWGAECREAFGAVYHDNWYQAGTDASGLELRTLGHYLYPFDNGEYSDTAVNGDIHTKNQIAAGLPSRDNAKTFNTMGVYKPI